jgi:hypothetical protein
MHALDDKPRKFVSADFSYGATTWKDVAVRFKGHQSMRGWGEKPAFKIDFGRHGQRRFLGRRSLTLNNMVEDPTMAREALAYSMYRAAGVPAPRTGYAELFVNGELQGLYLIVETPDDDFVASHLGGATNLYEGEYGCDLVPPDAPGFDQDAGEDHSHADLAALAAAVSTQGPALFGPSSPFDVQEVLAYLATAALLGDFDGYRRGHNYRLARRPDTGRWLFLPWGEDRVFKRHMDLHDSDGVVARRCWADAACRAAYDREVVTLADRFAELDLPRKLDELAASIAPAVQRDRSKPYTDAEVAARRADLKAFLEERWREVRGQVTCLDGDQERDADGDGYGCLDCNDADPRINPKGVETCGDRVDNDCSGYVDDAPACDCPVFTVGGRDFRLCNFPMAWHDAAAFCEGMGLSLARIDGQQESKALYDAAKKVRDERWWIGLNDVDQEGKFVWRDGSAVGFAFWAKDQPDNDACNEDCVALKDGGKGKWHDQSCGQRRAFICAARDPGD